MQWQRQRNEELNSTLTLEANKYDDPLASPITDLEIKEDWSINVHRKVWQSDLLDTFAYNGTLSLFTTADAVKYIANKFGLLEPINRLSNEYNITPDNVEILNERELSFLPSPYLPVKIYLTLLEKLKVVRGFSGDTYKPIHLYFDNDIKQDEKPSLLLTGAEHDSIQSSAKQYDRKIRYDAESAIKQGKVDSKEQRIKAMIAAEKRVFNENKGQGRLCVACGLTSLPSNGEICPFCRSQNTHPYDVSESDITNAINRYRSSAKPNRSVEDQPTLNLELLSSWLDD